MRAWVKLYTEALNDPVVGRLTDRQHRTFVNLLLLAGMVDDDGRLGTPADVAWHLRVGEEQVGEDVAALAAAGIVEERDSPEGSELWLANFARRQARPASENPDAVRERVQRHRAEAKRGHKKAVTDAQRPCNEGVTASDQTRSDPDQEKIQKRSDPDPEQIQTMFDVGRLLSIFAEDAGEELSDDLAARYTEEFWPLGADRVRAWCHWVGRQKGVRNRIGFLVTCLRSGKVPPGRRGGHELLELAEPSEQVDREVDPDMWEEWPEILVDLSGRMDKATFRTHIAGTVARRVDGEVRIGIRPASMPWMERLRPIIEPAVRLRDPVRVVFEEVAGG